MSLTSISDFRLENVKERRTKSQKLNLDAKIEKSQSRVDPVKGKEKVKTRLKAKKGGLSRTGGGGATRQLRWPLQIHAKQGSISSHLPFLSFHYVSKHLHAYSKIQNSCQAG